MKRHWLFLGDDETHARFFPRSWMILIGGEILRNEGAALFFFPSICQPYFLLHQYPLIVT